MNIATVHKSNATISPHAGPVARRFVWKEFRTLRGLWLAAIVLAALIQVLLNYLSPPSAPHATILFSTALAAGALYAVAAAATTFSLEHEEETYDFLACLPLTWRPVYVGKVTVVTASALLLAAAATITGCILRGFETPPLRDALITLGVLGVAIVEAIAWGILFSLLIKRPLVAALCALVCGTASANLALILSASRNGSNLMTVAYVQAIPFRLAFAAGALIVSAMVARQWLTTSAAPAGSARLFTPPRWRAFRALIGARHGAIEAVPQQGSQRQMLARLLWQTWRDGRKILMLPIVVAALLLLMVAVVIVLAEPKDDFELVAWLSTALFIPALYGALAFSADQRRGSYRFLAEHAARPRFVWLSRHAVWLGVPIVLAAALTLVGLALAFRWIAPRVFDEAWWVGVSEIQDDFAVSTNEILHGAALAWWGVLTAYAIGQLCSMLVRSEILAAFLALIASVFVTAWCAACFAWQLSGWLFVLPIAVASLLATWLRAPDWMAGRNTWKAWLKPVLVLIAPFALIAVALPSVRLAQITAPAPVMSRNTVFGEVPSKFQQDIESILVTYTAADTPEARETAAMYERAARALDWDEDDPLAPWQKPQYAKADKPGEIDEAKIPTDEREAYQQAVKRRDELSEQAKAEAIRLAMEASARPDCYFDFDFSQWVVAYPPLYEQLNKLLVVLWTIEPGDPFDRLLAALRMSAHLRIGQPSFVFFDQLMKENAILEQIGHWAADEGRTKEELALALEQLTGTLSSWPSVQGALVADHRQVEDALTGKATSWALSESPRSLWVNLAYLGHQLPWEQRRAVLALGAITRQNIAYAEEFDSYISGQSSTEVGPYLVRRWLRPNVSPSPEPMWVSAQPAAATSHFTRLEYEMRTRVPDIFLAFCENEACRHAARVQIALAMYRSDHGAYPQALAELVPDYLALVPLDPFARQPFQYESRGLDLPLRGWRGRYSEIRLEPHTPFFWSVGAGNARLKQSEASEIEEGDSRGETVVRWETVYALIDEIRWSGSRAFVFPLPALKR